MVGYCSDKLIKGDYVHQELKFFDPLQFFGYIGIAMFSFEGNGIVINLQAEAQNKKRYPSHLRFAVLTIIIWYMILSTVCYATYRGTAGSVDYITQLLPIGPLTIAINLLFCVNAITSYPVQILCAFEIVEELTFFNNTSDSKVLKNVKLYTERVLIILVVTMAAIVIPKFVDFLNISGSLGSAALGFILPPLYHMKSVGGIKNMPKHIAAFNVFLIFFGVFGAIYSLYNSISKLVNGK
ncbi:hypothetical protein FGO68_gene13750 [Halteria grandinella]|uniref:Amino acid transporter transmembrane domain-containing protein n=1 Tax=Halteria grandinella TaxID=5974 RepID=A0A8J8SVX1_HALGN|nr:hypothetical protein FGO68_gene13750 [Halteria grandinella]